MFYTPRVQLPTRGVLGYSQDTTCPAPVPVGGAGLTHITGCLVLQGRSPFVVRRHEQKARGATLAADPELACHHDTEQELFVSHPPPTKRPGGRHHVQTSTLCYASPGRGVILSLYRRQQATALLHTTPPSRRALLVAPQPRHLGSPAVAEGEGWDHPGGGAPGRNHNHANTALTRCCGQRRAPPP